MFQQCWWTPHTCAQWHHLGVLLEERQRCTAAVVEEELNTEGCSGTRLLQVPGYQFPSSVSCMLLQFPDWEENSEMLKGYFQLGLTLFTICANCEKFTQCSCLLQNVIQEWMVL